MLLFPLVYVFILKGSPKYYELIVALVAFSSIHWPFFKGECIISYINKKLKDCSYRMGDRIESEDLSIFIPGYVGPFVAVLLLVPTIVMSRYLHYNVPLLVFVTVFKIFIHNVMLGDILLALATVYFIKDNKYTVPGLLIISFSSLILKYFDVLYCKKEEITIYR
jgi:hypothetical protein